jgi:hypothetical protein
MNQLVGVRINEYWTRDDNDGLEPCPELILCIAETKYDFAKGTNETMKRVEINTCRFLIASDSLRNFGETLIKYADSIQERSDTNDEFNKQLRVDEEAVKAVSSQ